MSASEKAVSRGAAESAEGKDSTRPWWFWVVYPGPRRPKYGRHPLCALAGLRCYSEAMAMNWLQERGWISDLCQGYDDVAPVDVARVLRAAGQEVLLPEGWKVAFNL